MLSAGAQILRFAQDDRGNGSVNAPLSTEYVVLRAVSRSLLFFPRAPNPPQRLASRRPVGVFADRDFPVAGCLRFFLVCSGAFVDSPATRAPRGRVGSRRFGPVATGDALAGISAGLH